MSVYDFGILYDVMFACQNKLGILAANSGEQNNLSKINLKSVSEDYLPLFFQKNDMSFFEMIMYQNINKISSHVAKDYIAVLFSNEKEIVQKLFSFYFENEELILREQSEMALREITERVLNSQYPELLKNKLILFYLHPEAIIKDLIYSMCDLIDQISTIYNNCFDELSAVSAEIERTGINSIIDRLCYSTQYDYIYLAVGALMPNRVKANIYKNGIFVYIGKNYGNTKTSKLSSLLLATGAVFGDEARIRILDYILNNDGAGRKDLERELAIHPSTLYHHLSVLIDSGAICFSISSSRNHLYYLNKCFFKNLTETLQKYSAKYK